MGKKRIIKKGGDTRDEQALLQDAKTKAQASKKKLDKATVHVQSTYNNTLITISDMDGNILFQSSSGALGFKGSKKGTPYAASKAAEIIGEFATHIGVKEMHIRVKGIGSGRESAIRVFTQHGFSINSIKDVTPTPHGTPRLKKPRRV
ncbi:MAG: 30S ribosomal protein S11 [bacterium]|nr:30S ribosomal protein S11 [bacterium]